MIFDELDLFRKNHRFSLRGFNCRLKIYNIVLRKLMWVTYKLWREKNNFRFKKAFSKKAFLK
jgi:hypothetical protein